ncbi:MAG: protein kinase [Acidobacteria bacterium]|nr:protein kinase [Acidobacteriota bacterium]
MTVSVAAPARSFRRQEVVIPLKSGFRFLHEPIHEPVAERFVGRQVELAALADRIQFSSGGSFLLTGYRGVGKTSFVNQVVRLLEQRCPLLDVQVSLARPLSAGELMHHIIRRLYERLHEKQMYSRLSAELQEELALAYQRTSVNMVRRTTEGWEGAAELGVKVPRPTAVLEPTLKWKRSKIVDLQTSFLCYDDRAAEHDIVRISRRLAGDGLLARRTTLERLRDRLLGRPTQKVELKIVFVFDELDKIEEQPTSNGSGRPVIDELLGSLKTLFTTSGICFVFVAGKDLHERWLEDLGRGDSIYESVFSYDRYLPCLWSGVPEICDQLVDWSAPPELLPDPPYARSIFETLKDYLAYKGRGIPRRILRAFNECVEWSDGRPEIVFAAEDVRRIRFYSQLYQIIEKNAGRLFGSAQEDSSGTQQDKRRLGVYYVIDWVLRQGSHELTAEDLVRASKQLSSRVAMAEEVAADAVVHILGVLEEGEYIEPVQQRLDQAEIGDVSARRDKRYRLTERRLAEMSGLAGAFEEESYVLGAGRGVAQRVGQYELLNEVGRGGMGIVYRAWDQKLHRIVAVKLLPTELSAEPRARERFRREWEVVRSLRHPNIVPFYDSGEHEGQMYLVMDYIEGLDLSTLLAVRGRLDRTVALAILMPAIEAFQYAHSKGLVRLDVKPGNIRISTGGRVYVMDFGLAKRRDSVSADTPALTDSGTVVGTWYYIAPEQLIGRSADARADVYSLGAVLYETLTGRRPFAAETVGSLVMQHLNEQPMPPSRLASIPQEIDAIILRCLAKKPEERFQSMADLAAAVSPWFAPNEAPDLAALVSLAVRDSASRANVAEAKTAFGAVMAPPPLPASEAPTTESTLLPWPCLLLLGANRRPERTFPLSEGANDIGRSPNIAISLPNETLSRFHARITRRDGQCLLEDLNSSNGSSVNGKRVTEPVLLHDGDLLEIGDVIFEFRGPLTAG